MHQNVFFNIINQKTKIKVQIYHLLSQNILCLGDNNLLSFRFLLMVKDETKYATLLSS